VVDDCRKHSARRDHRAASERLTRWPAESACVQAQPRESASCAPRATRILRSRSRLLTIYDARPHVPVIESSNPKRQADRGRLGRLWPLGPQRTSVSDRNRGIKITDHFTNGNRHVVCGRVGESVRSRTISDSLCAALVYSSRSSIMGSTESARRAGIHAATRPSSAMARTTPASTSGSRGVA
jgi:hypothetical protein